MGKYNGWQIRDYRLVRWLGSGATCHVYLAEHLYDHTQVAIKLFLSGFSRDEAISFINEVGILMLLKHEHIVPVIGCGIDALVGSESRQADIPFLAMEYAPGGTLQDRIPIGWPAPPDVIVKYVRQVATALQFSHDNRRIHCDVKPANLLLAAGNRVLLSDFGIVAVTRTTTALSLRSWPAGTPRYMAPEQWKGRAQKASDQYSLAVVVYQWLTGHYPFEASSVLELRWQHVNQPPPSLIAYVPTLPDAVERVILKALEKDPELRFASVKEFADNLERAFGESSATITLPRESFLPPDLGRQPSDGPMQPATSPVKTKRLSRRAAIVAGGTVTGLALVGGVAWFVVHGQQSLVSTPTPTPTPKLSPTPTSTPFPIGSVLHRYGGHLGFVNTIAWSPDGTFLASGGNDGTVKVWRPVNDLTVFTYKGHQPDIVSAVAWSPDGSRIASGGFDKTVQVWDAPGGGHALTYPNHANYVDAVAWSPDSSRVASGSYDLTVRVWGAADGKDIYVYDKHSRPVSTVAWSPDGKRIASGSYDGTVHVWDATDGGHDFTYSGHGSNSVNAVAWSPDGKYIASASSDKTVQVWDATDGKLLYTYAGHSDVVGTVTWSPNSRRVASGGVDTTVQVWDAADGGHSFTYRQHTAEVRAVEWSPDGRQIASAGSDATVQIWGAG